MPEADVAKDEVAMAPTNLTRQTAAFERFGVAVEGLPEPFGERGCDIFRNQLGGA